MDLAKLTREMLELANTPPKGKVEKLIKKANLLAGHETALNERTCEALFLQADPEAYARVTHLTAKETQRLHQMIGQYILLSRKKDHLSAIVKEIHAILETEEAIQKLPADKKKELVRLNEKKNDQFQTLGDWLQSMSYVDPYNDPPAFMVFEHLMGVYLRPEQVEKLRKVLPKDGKFPDLILQLIQGGGKTFVFGHILALLKADGYHLSIHVAPTAQYKTAINDMKFNSNRAFGQKEHTFEFDDHSELFTESYLGDLEHMLHSVIVNKEYVTVTKETLRAMRGKYLSTRRQIEAHLEKTEPWKNRSGREEILQEGRATSAPRDIRVDMFAGEYIGVDIPIEQPVVDDFWREPGNIQALEKSNAILERILCLMDERGVFTFDEIHIAGDPYEELNMPTGAKEKIDFDHADLISEIVLEAAAGRSSENKPLLHLNQNQQSQQKEADFRLMREKIVDKLLGNEKRKESFGLKGSPEDAAQIEQLRAYILGETDELPDYLHELHLESIKRNPKAATPAHLVILAHQMLSKDWLKNSLNLSVSEHHGFPSEESLASDASLARVSIPYIANMTPAEGSEFSDRFVVITNTYISYAVLGLNETQVKELSQMKLQEAFQEYSQKRSEGESIELEETQAFKDFQEVTGLNLLKDDFNLPETVSSAMKGLKSDTSEARKLLFNFAMKKELPKVNFYVEQIASHGQNTFGMGKSTNGYSGSIENPSIKPVGAEVLHEEGTNGQSIDLLCRKNDDLWVVGNKPEDLFSLFRDHPQKERLRAIIDIGCQFRGVPNKEAAKMICGQLDVKSPVKGVLYFDQNELYFMQNNAPDFSVKKLTGTKKETIEAETGCTPDELFTYYDQDHITGVDIAQASDALAIGTVSEHTQIHEVLQGFRRLRRADFGQRIAFAVQQGALTSIGNALDKKDIDALPLGKIDKEKCNIHDLILFAHLKEIEPQPDQGTVLSVQKMEDLVQTAVFRKMAQLSLANKRVAFSNTSYLFVKNIGVDLYRDYAVKKTTANPDAYYPFLARLLLEPLQGITFRNGEKFLTSEEYASLKEDLDTVVTEAIETAKKEILVPANFEQVKSAAAIQPESRAKIQNRTLLESEEPEGEEAASAEAIAMGDFREHNRAGTQTQVQEQQTEEVGAQKQSQELQQKALDKQRQMNLKMPGAEKFILKEKEWSLASFLDSLAHMKPIALLYPNDPPQIWNLNEVLNQELQKGPATPLDARLHVTSNLAKTFRGQTGVIIPPKSAYQVLVVRDPATKDLKIVLCTVKESRLFDHLLRQEMSKETPVVLTQVSGMLLARAGVAETIHTELDTFSHEVDQDVQLKSLLLQVYFLNGRLDILSDRKNFEAFKALLKDSAVKAQFRDFFSANLVEKVDVKTLKMRAYKFLME